MIYLMAETTYKVKWLLKEIIKHKIKLMHANDLLLTYYFPNQKGQSDLKTENAI